MSSGPRRNLRELPAIGKLLSEPQVQVWLAEHPPALVTEALRLAVDEHRRRLVSEPNHAAPVVSEVLQSAGERLSQVARSSLRRVINATGVVLHTGLGRAPLGEAALAAIAGAAGGYCNLELDLATGERGQRSRHVTPLLCRLTGAEAAAVVNNNAAATLMVLKAVAMMPASGETPRASAGIAAGPGAVVSSGANRGVATAGAIPGIATGIDSGASAPATPGISTETGPSGAIGSSQCIGAEAGSDIAAVASAGSDIATGAGPGIATGANAGGGTGAGPGGGTGTCPGAASRPRNVIVSRGQLVEIGGSFRLPEIMAESGVELREVGTTNRTRLDDYRRAIDGHTAALMRVHTSNYRIVGFTQDVPIGELAALAHAHGLPVIDDLGSGALYPMNDEPVVANSIQSGADLVCFSGDKLLGGPQAGIIVGRQPYIRAIERHPLMRTYRLDKLVLLALEATLRCHLDGRTATRSVPTLAMLEARPEGLEARAQHLLTAIQASAPAYRALLRPDTSYAGGGSRPAEPLPTWVVAIAPQAPDSAAALARALRTADPPIIARIHGESVLFDVRTLSDPDVTAIANTLARLQD